MGVHTVGETWVQVCQVEGIDIEFHIRWEQRNNGLFPDAWRYFDNRTDTTRRLIWSTDPLDQTDVTDWLERQTENDWHNISPGQANQIRSRPWTLKVE